LTERTRVEAARLVQDGTFVSCSLVVDPLAGHFDDIPPSRHMIRTGEGLFDPNRVTPRPPMNGRGFMAIEHIGMKFHGHDITHLDAPCHAFWDGLAYNGVPAAKVTAEMGATALAVTACKGLVTRGVLLDLPRAQGRPWLEPGTAVCPEDLEAAEENQGVTVKSGDAVLLRTGHGAVRNHLGAQAAGEGPRSGWNPACMPWLRARGAALIGHDGTNDVMPVVHPEMAVPVHLIGLVAMGLWLLDGADLEQLSASCAAKNRWSFLFTLAPLRLEGATGSQVNPLAVF
jgi:kynurenine formamidase